MNPEDSRKDTPPDDAPEEHSGAESSADASAETLPEGAPDTEDNDTDAPLIKQEFNVPPQKPRGRGFIDLLILLVLAGLGGGEYVLFQKFKADRDWTTMKIVGIEHKLETLAQRKPTAPAVTVSPELKNTLDNLSAQIEALKGQTEQARNQSEEALNQVRNEMAQLKSAPPAAEEPVEEEVEEEAEAPHAEAPASDAHEAGDAAKPEQDFIEFVENMFRIVGNGIKDGVVFVWDSLSDLAGGKNSS